MNLELLAKLLRSPGEVIALCQEGQQRSVASVALVAIAASGAAFGAVVGAGRGGPQILLSALKLPLASLLSLALSGPILLAVASVFGRRWCSRTVLALMLAAGARSSLALLAMVPGLLLLVSFGAGYFALKLAATAAFALAGLSALAVLLRSLGPAPGRAPAALVFIGLFLIAGAQSAWVLRPYIGDPADGVMLVAKRQEGGLATALLEALALRPSGRR